MNHSQASNDEIARLRQALEDVCDPLAYLKRLAEAEGNRLSGMAYAIANDINTVKRIARDALTAAPKHSVLMEAAQRYMQEAAAKVARADNATRRTSAEKRICYRIAATIREIPLALASGVDLAAAGADESVCLLCADKCRGHGLADPVAWEPEVGSLAALARAKAGVGGA